jgi:hypothetical protein
MPDLKYLLYCCYSAIPTLLQVIALRAIVRDELRCEPHSASPSSVSNRHVNHSLAWIIPFVLLLPLIAHMIYREGHSLGPELQPVFAGTRDSLRYIFEYGDRCFWASTLLTAGSFMFAVVIILIAPRSWKCGRRCNGIVKAVVFVLLVPLLVYSQGTAIADLSESLCVVSDDYGCRERTAFLAVAFLCFAISIFHETRRQAAQLVSDDLCSRSVREFLIRRQLQIAISIVAVPVPLFTLLVVKQLFLPDWSGVVP